MQINDKAYNAFLTMFGDIDFSKSGYRPPLDEPLIFATLSGKTINILSKMGYEMEAILYWLAHKNNYYMVCELKSKKLVAHLQKMNF